MSEDFEEYLRICVPKDLSLDSGWELEALLRTLHEAMQAAQTGKDGETYQITVEAPANLDRQELGMLFEVVAKAAHAFEKHFPQRTWDVFVAGGVLSEDHSAEAAFHRVCDENEVLRKELLEAQKRIVQLKKQYRDARKQRDRLSERLAFHEEVGDA